MGFNRNDLQDDNDDFSFDDDFNLGDSAGGDDDFKFDDEPADIGLGEDAGAGGFGFEGEDMPELDNEDGGGDQRGTSRTFIILAIVMIVLFVLGLGAVVLISLGPKPPSSIDETRVAIENINATTVAQLANTQTAAPLIALTQTADALQIALAQTATANAPTETPRPPTVTPTFTVTPAPALDETQLAATSIAQQTEQAAQVAFSLTQTALAATPTPAQPSVGDVALTATALVAILAPPGQGGGEVPTQEVFGATPGGPIPTALPQTGFFDDLAAGNANAGLIALLALGLVGVIGVSRYLRTVNNK